MNKKKNIASYSFPDDAPTINATEMADALQIIAGKLLHWDLITSEGYSALIAEVSRLRRFNKAHVWNYGIDREMPVAFSQTKDKNGDPIYPLLVCEGISVEPKSDGLPPFTSFDIAIEILNSTRTPVARWHIDLANCSPEAAQSGPLLHLQYGGHFAGFRHLDHPLKVPRWSHPPLDLPLLCEIIVANFYTEYWELLRDDLNWRNAILVSQKLCYFAYITKMVNSYSDPRKSILQSMWTSEWGLGN